MLQASTAKSEYVVTTLDQRRDPLCWPDSKPFAFESLFETQFLGGDENADIEMPWDAPEAKPDLEASYRVDDCTVGCLSSRQCGAKVDTHCVTHSHCQGTQ